MVCAMVSRCPWGGHSSREPLGCFCVAVELHTIFTCLYKTISTMLAHGTSKRSESQVASTAKRLHKALEAASKWAHSKH